MPAKRKDPEDIYVRIAFTLPPQLDAQLREHCRRRDRTVAWVLQKAITEYLERHTNDREED